MFVEAIDIAAKFTRAIHTISRNYQSTTVVPSAATLFFVNADGWALTCSHVVKVVIGAEQLSKRRQAFKSELASGEGKTKRKQLLKRLEKKYNLSRRATFEIRNVFFNCVEGPLDVEVIGNDKLDVALIHFRNYTQLLCNDFPVFAADGSQIKPGKYLCRLGFPFPEFSNFRHDSVNDTIEWTDSGKRDTPRFPIDGMVTRHLLGSENRTVGFEMSTPGLRGQSGGPAFDTEGRVWGMQSSTAHLDLNFDVSQEVLREGRKKRVSDSAFLHVGHCIHVDVLKSFMKEHGVSFREG